MKTDCAATLELDEAGLANLAFILNDYIAAQRAQGFTTTAGCGCCTLGDHAVAAMHLLLELGANLVDESNRDFLCEDAGITTVRVPV